MGTGHVRFFYDKLLFLQKRLADIIAECHKRGFKISFTLLPSLEHIPEQYCQDYSPTPADLAISIQRIQEKLNQKPDFYTFYGKKIEKN